ncbi:protein FATTY ACID EXPORT 2, chloroplastic [Amborella trichopoda]|uniref:Uncharacterized protein n=1 Tax=Amborella trichopoda TaxID=13333 RepID=W1NR31_AMBTC|nr:protein FATTY ACID EXPORT 2, chloroplastic [Amborella trichopoda]ERM99406.1 hypothetical protein AMTR_s00131p00046730 [Amborella trichopoda]|eukprot:XP_006836553.1 protein FATTY ACID EXPORT 2, chloroplastic [Amborella trichopoda]
MALCAISQSYLIIHPPATSPNSSSSTRVRSLCIKVNPLFLSHNLKGNRRVIRASAVADSEATVPLIIKSSSESEPLLNPLKEEKIEFDLGGGGGSKGFGGGGRGGGGGGDNNGGGEEGEHEGEDSSKKKMSMSQKLTFGYAALVGLGGVMGYLKSGSQKSLAAGGLSALLLYYVHTQLPVRPVLASTLGLGISAALLAVMGSRFKNSGKIFPAGVVSLVSLIMTGGYLHGIFRSSH